MFLIIYWSFNANPGWYIVPTLEHYQCRNVDINKMRKEQASDTLFFFPKFTIPCIPLRDAKTCASQYVSKMLPHTNTGRPTQKIRFITRWSNLLYLGNIQPDRPPTTTTKVTTKERNRTHNLPREINNTTTGRTITGRNTSDPRTNNNYLWYHTSKCSNFSTWLWWFTISKGTSEGEDVTNSMCTRHKSPSQQEPNVITYRNQSRAHLQFVTHV